MNVFEAIKGRRSIRAFAEKKVSETDIKKLIEAAIWAPSAGNIQPWEFVIVTDAEVKRKLASAALNQIFIEESSVVIVVCANEIRSGRGYGVRGLDLYSIQDTAAATQNILLGAYALGLGACWVGAFDEENVKRVLNMPLRVRPVAIVPVGYPAENPAPRPKRPMQKILHFNTF